MAAVDDEYTLRTALERYDDIDPSWRGCREATLLEVRLRSVVWNMTSCSCGMAAECCLEHDWRQAQRIYVYSLVGDILVFKLSPAQSCCEAA